MSSDPRVHVHLTANVTAMQDSINRTFGRLAAIGAGLKALGDALLGWDHPDNPYHDWPTCPSPVEHEAWFTTEGTTTRPCPGCGAVL